MKMFQRPKALALGVLFFSLANIRLCFGIRSAACTSVGQVPVLIRLGTSYIYYEPADSAGIRNRYGGWLNELELARSDAQLNGAEAEGRRRGFPLGE